MLTLTLILSLATLLVPPLSIAQGVGLLGACFLIACFPSFFLTLALLIGGVAYLINSR